jgi:hypothetical protein
MLTPEQYETVVAKFKDERNFFRVIRNESDRGCAFVGSVHLDYLLGELIKPHMIDDPDWEQLFSNGTIASFTLLLAEFFDLELVQLNERQKNGSGTIWSLFYGWSA